MTITNNASQVSIQGDGGTTAFPFNFVVGYTGSPSSVSTATANTVVSIVDSIGTITVLNTSQYGIVFTAPLAGATWGVGGTITYPTSGPPLPVGSFIVIQRLVPLTQLFELTNQASYGTYQTTIERLCDTLEMQIQQLSNQLGRQIEVAISDDPPLPLPPTVQRANKFLAFDSSGNPIAATSITGTPVSSAMQPVVSASTLALGRTALGLGALATEGIGAGLQDDGSNKVRVIFTPVPDGGSQSVTAAFHLTERHATGALVYTNPASSTLFSGFCYWVYALTGSITFAIDAADSFSGMASGVSFTVPPGNAVFISTDGTGTWYARTQTLGAAGGATNLQISASIASNNLTVAIKDRNGNDPSTASPVIMAFRDPTIANGNPVYAVLTNSLSVVAPNGATFGAIDNIPFRLWLVAYNDAGTIRIGLINCLSGTNIYPLGQIPLASSTLISAGATSSQVFYTNGAGVASKAYVILGYLNWESGLATAGAWSATATRIQLFGQNVPLPGFQVQVQGTATGATASGSTVIPLDDTIPQITEGVEFMTQAITPTSATNLLRISSQLFMSGASATNIIAALFQDATADALKAVNQLAAGVNAMVQLDMLHSMLAATTSSATFRVRAGGSSAGNFTFNGPTVGGRYFGGVFNSFLEVTEIQG